MRILINLCFMNMYFCARTAKILAYFFFMRVSIKMFQSVRQTGKEHYSYLELLRCLLNKKLIIFSINSNSNHLKSLPCDPRSCIKGDETYLFFLVNIPSISSDSHTSRRAVNTFYNLRQVPFFVRFRELGVFPHKNESFANIFCF